MQKYVPNKSKNQTIRCSCPEGSSGPGPRQRQRGQLVFEYILLLLIAVSMAFIVRNRLTRTGAGPEQSGSLIQLWRGIVQTIGEDQPVDPAP